MKINTLKVTFLPKYFNTVSHSSTLSTTPKIYFLALLIFAHWGDDANRNARTETQRHAGVSKPAYIETFANKFVPLFVIKFFS
jgi:hypothetical protein